MEKEFLKKEDLLFGRDEKGELVPIEIEISKGKKIKVTPIPKGEWDKMMMDKSSEEDKDARLIEKHLIEPKITYDELIKSGSAKLILKIATAILKMSSKSFDDDIKVPVKEVKKDMSMKPE